MYLGEYIVMHILIIFILLAAKSAVSECHYVGVPERTNRTTDDVAVGTVVEYSCLVPGETFSNGFVRNIFTVIYLLYNIFTIIYLL